MPRHPLVRESTIPPVIISVAAHAAIILMYLATPQAFWRTTSADNFVTTALRYLLPPLPEAPGAAAEPLYYVAAGQGVIEKPAEATVKESGTIPAPREEPKRGDSGEDERTAVSLEQAAVAQSALTVEEVDSTAVRDPSSAGPDYPPALRKVGLEGYASMRFVVDSTGMIDMGSVETIEATHPEFARAVRDAMPRMHFRPARFGARAVRQISEQRFRFRIEPATVAGPAARTTRPQE